MASPNIFLVIEPRVHGVVRYLALAPAVPGDGERFQLSFEANFINRSNRTLHLTQMRVSFPAAPNLGFKDIQLKTLQDDQVTVTNGLDLTRAGTPKANRWANDFVREDNFILTSTPPGTIQFEVSADNFDEPAVFTFNLARHESPVAGGAYLWMGKAHDLRRGEYWKGIGADHCCGHQLFAHDLKVERFSKSKNGWTSLLSGKDKSKNEHYRIWEKPVYAMADGVVKGFDNHFHDNLVLGELPENPPSAYGNHFIIRHGSDLVVYAHFKQLSLNPALMQIGATVKAGDFLGLVGNSGNSSEPHLHIHCVDEATGRLRPIPWQQKMLSVRDLPAVIPRSWTSSQRQGLPVLKTVIYPGDTPPADDREWSAWESLGGELIFGPCVCSRGDDRLDVFGVGLDRALWHKWWDGNRWHEWENLGGELTAKPAAVSWGLNRIDVFGRGVNNQLFHKWFDGDDWHDWEGLGGNLLSGPAVCSRQINHLDVFMVRAEDSALGHRFWNGARWSEWESLGGELTEDPATVSWNSDRIDVFARGVDGTLYQKWWNGAWHNWAARNRPTLYGPAVSSRRRNRLDVFVVAPDGTLQHNLWNGSEWTPWESLGGFLTAAPAAVSWGPNRIDVFGRGGNTALFHTLWEPS